VKTILSSICHLFLLKTGWINTINLFGDAFGDAFGDFMSKGIQSVEHEYKYDFSPIGGSN